MTETSILPGATPESDAGNAMVPPPLDVEEAAGDSRRRLMILGLIAAIVVIAGAAYLLLHKSSSPSSDSSFTPPQPVQSAAPQSGGTAGGTTHSGGTTQGNKPGTVLPKKSHVRLARDPFHPLVVAPAAGASSPGATASQQPVSTQTVPPQTQSTTPTVTITQPTTVTGGGAPPSNGQSTSGTPLWIELKSVKGTHAAVFDVGYAHHKFRRFEVIAPRPTSSRGTVFDGQFALLSIQDNSVTVQVGDDTPFDLTPKVAHSV